MVEKHGDQRRSYIDPMPLSMDREDLIEERAIAITLSLFYPKVKKIRSGNNFNHVDKSAKIGKNVVIGPGVVICEGVVIGDGTEIGANTVIQDNTIIGSNCILYPNVTLYDNLVLGENIIIHSGSVIGADGFGFVKEK